MNKSTVDNKYISHLHDPLGKCQYFSTLGIISGFYQSETKSKDILKVTFYIEIVITNLPECCSVWKFHFPSCHGQFPSCHSKWPLSCINEHYLFCSYPQGHLLLCLLYTVCTSKYIWWSPIEWMLSLVYSWCITVYLLILFELCHY